MEHYNLPHIRIYTFIHVCLPICIHVCIHAYMYTCIPYIHKYIQTYIHTYMYTCIHVNVCSDEKTPASKPVQRDSFMLQRPEYIITYICKCALGTGYSSTKMISQFDTSVSLDRCVVLRDSGIHMQIIL